MGCLLLFYLTWFDYVFEHNLLLQNFLNYRQWNLGEMRFCFDHHRLLREHLNANRREAVRVRSLKKLMMALVALLADAVLGVVASRVGANRYPLKYFTCTTRYGVIR